MSQYVFTCLSPITHLLFRKEDGVLLEYLNEDVVGTILEFGNKKRKIFSNACEVHTPKNSPFIMSSFLASTIFGDGMRTINHAMLFSNSRVVRMR